jgi:hypothetical protein
MEAERETRLHQENKQGLRVGTEPKSGIADFWLLLLRASRASITPYVEGRNHPLSSWVCADETIIIIEE